MRAAAGTVMVAALAALVPARAAAQVFGAPEETTQELVAQEPGDYEGEPEPAVRPAGSLAAHMLIADGDLGGLVMLDVWAAWQWLRVGAFLGAGAIPSDDDERNRVMMPLGVSAAAELVATEHLALSVRLRAGLWGGATQAEKLTLGPFFGGGLYLGLLLGGGAVLNVGADVWGVIGSEAWRDASAPDVSVSASTWVIAPGVGLSWTPEEGG